ncbi:hypothetical protein SAMN02745244_02486 [Tessaracoccus bendigoensis DSM 12906]|uniref:DUF4276 family protein n=2 Tax=Tessaracoccus TaxID=72763 RepID=A0A1M6J8R3_9ACTN|nr:hypothetical protein SAMN02745244_02486 [Tessaracoccus bendigoensis DSM 12906]
MIYVAVEGESDRGAATAVVAAAGHVVARVYVSGGKSKLDPSVAKYLRAAQRSSWVVFRDSDGQCPVELKQKLLPAARGSSPRFTLRIAHTMTEAWLLADRRGFASYFGVREEKVPIDPEALNHAKRALLLLCAQSAPRAVRRDVVTADGLTGPLYVSRLNDFATNHWDVARAAENSPSLARAIAAIRLLPA